MALKCKTNVGKRTLRALFVLQKCYGHNVRSARARTPSMKGCVIGSVVSGAIERGSVLARN